MMDLRSLPIALFMLASVALVLAPTDEARGQGLTDVLRYSQQLPASGGPTMGRAGAGLSAGVGDYTSLFGNPAGLGWASSMIGGDFAVHNTRSDTRFQTPDANVSADRGVTDYRLGSLGGTYSFPTERGALVLGVSFHQSNAYERGFDITGSNRTNSITGTLLPSSFQVSGDEITFGSVRSRIAYEAGAIDFSQAVFDDGNYPFFQGADPRSGAVDGEMTLEQQDNVLESGQLNELSVGGAVAVAPNTMLGFGLNYVFGAYTFERFFREFETSGLLPPEDPQNPQRPYDPYFLSGTALEGFNELRVEDRVDTDLGGANLRFGLSTQPVDALRMGVHVETPTWLNITEVFGTRMETRFDCDFSRNVPCPQGGVPGFESGSLDGSEFEYDIRTPWRFGGGLQVSAAGLTLAGGLTYIDWSQAELTPESEDSQSSVSFGDLNRTLQGLDPTINTRLGAEYAVDDFTLRTGFAYQPSPTDRTFPAVDGGSTNGDQLFLSAGFSYDLSGPTTFHLNWMQERFDDQFVSYGAASGDSPVVRESVARNRVTIGITYRP